MMFKVKETLLAVIFLGGLAMVEGNRWHCKPTLDGSLCAEAKDPEVCYPDDDYGGMFRSCFDACHSTNMNSIYDEDCKRKCPGYISNNCNVTMSDKTFIENPTIYDPKEKTGYDETTKSHSDVNAKPEQDEEHNDTQTELVMGLVISATAMITIIILALLYRQRQGNKLKVKKEVQHEESSNGLGGAKRKEKKRHVWEQAIVGQIDEVFNPLVKKNLNQAQTTHCKAKRMCANMEQPVDDQIPTEETGA